MSLIRIVIGSVFTLIVSGITPYQGELMLDESECNLRGGSILLDTCVYMESTNMTNTAAFQKCVSNGGRLINLPNASYVDSYDALNITGLSESWLGLVKVNNATTALLQCFQWSAGNETYPITYTNKFSSTTVLSTHQYVSRTYKLGTWYWLFRSPIIGMKVVCQHTLKTTLSSTDPTTATNHGSTREATLPPTTTQNTLPSSYTTETTDFLTYDNAVLLNTETVTKLTTEKNTVDLSSDFTTIQTVPVTSPKVQSTLDGKPTTSIIPPKEKAVEDMRKAKTNWEKAQKYKKKYDENGNLIDPPFPQGAIEATIFYFGTIGLAILVTAIYYYIGVYWW